MARRPGRAWTRNSNEERLDAEGGIRGAALILLVADLAWLHGSKHALRIRPGLQSGSQPRSLIRYFFLSLTFENQTRSLLCCHIRLVLSWSVALFFSLHAFVSLSLLSIFYFAVESSPLRVQSSEAEASISDQTREIASSPSRIHRHLSPA